VVAKGGAIGQPAGIGANGMGGQGGYGSTFNGENGSASDLTNRDGGQGGSAGGPNGWAPPAGAGGFGAIGVLPGQSTGIGGRAPSSAQNGFCPGGGGGGGGAGYIAAYPLPSGNGCQGAVIITPQ
jgi:hypothetical protein